MIKLSRKQAGDTIVEVLIAMAVISLVLVGAYISTNGNIATTQDAQERGQAVELLQTETEYLHKAGSIPNGNCFVVSGPTAGSPVPHGAPLADPCTVTSDGNMVTTDVEPAYSLKIVNDPVTLGVYDVIATWNSVTSGSAKDTITMYYQP